MPHCSAKRILKRAYLGIRRPLRATRNESRSSCSLGIWRFVIREVLLLLQDWPTRRIPAPPAHLAMQVFRNWLNSAASTGKFPAPGLFGGFPAETRLCGSFGSLFVSDETEGNDLPPCQLARRCRTVMEWLLNRIAALKSQRASRLFQVLCIAVGDPRLAINDSISESISDTLTK